MRRSLTIITDAATPAAFAVRRPLPQPDPAHAVGDLVRRSSDADDPLRPRLAILTLGCKVNYSETEALAEGFVRAGFRLVDPEVALGRGGSDNDETDADTADNSGCDVFVVNTCTVTHVADRKSRQMLRKAKRANPQALVVATGCYVYTSQPDVEALPEVDLVVSKRDEERMVELVAERLRYELPYRPEPSRLLFAGGLTDVGGVSHPHRMEIGTALSTGSAVESGLVYRTRAMVKIQDGCNAGCAFCIVPTARGGPRSVGIEEVVAGVQRKALLGYREVVLTGVHLGKYRAPVETEERPVRLKALLERVLAETTIPRLRITSLEPQDYDPTLLELWQRDPRIARHFHLALQAGSAATLARMRRGYSLERYTAIVEQIRRELPDASITTDIIVGFPGETDAEFAEGLDFARRMNFAKIHVFPYSPRAGTLAATMPDQVAEPVKKARGEAMRRLSDEMSRAWGARFVGQVRPVLWEEPTPRGDGLIWSGLTDNYLRVYMADPTAQHHLHNTITAARMLSLSDPSRLPIGESDGIIAELA